MWTNGNLQWFAHAPTCRSGAVNGAWHPSFGGVVLARTDAYGSLNTPIRARRRLGRAFELETLTDDGKALSIVRS